MPGAGGRNGELLSDVASLVTQTGMNLPAYGRPGFDVWVERSPGEGNGNPLQYSCLENFMDRGAWQAAVHRVTESQTQPKRFSTQTVSVLEMDGDDVCTTL